MAVKEELQLKKALGRLTSPERIQAFIDALRYSSDSFYRCPLRVLSDRRAHCFDGALIGAAALRFLGHKPLLVDFRAVRDDDHVLAVFRRGRFWGAVGKSNFVGLRFREPVYATLRELAMSYFEQYYNIEGERTLREYSVPLDLRRFDRLRWMTSDSGLDQVGLELDRVRHFRLITPAQARVLGTVDRRSYKAGMVGLDWKGVFKG